MDGQEQRPAGGFQRALTHITDEILAGRLHAGDRLPAERDLAERLGVGRSAVREAIKVLGAQGIVTSHVGHTGGTRIASAQGASFGNTLRLHMALQEISYDELTETRVLLERTATRAAALTASPEALAHLTDLCREMESTSEAATFNELDTRFHVGIAQIAHNRLVRDLTIAVREAVADHILTAEHDLTNWSEVQEQLVRQHRQILTALTEHDGARASQLAEEHVRRAHAVLLPAHTRARRRPPTAPQRAAQTPDQ